MIYKLHSLCFRKNQNERVLILNPTSKQENQSDDQQIRFYDLKDYQLTSYQLLLTSRETDHKIQNVQIQIEFRKSSPTSAGAHHPTSVPDQSTRERTTGKAS